MAGIPFNRRYATHASPKVWYTYGRAHNLKGKTHHTQSTPRYSNLNSGPEAAFYRIW